MNFIIKCFFGILLFPSFYVETLTSMEDTSGPSGIDGKNITWAAERNSTGNDLTSFTNIASDNLPEDALLDFVGLAVKYKLPVEVYEVTTQDGYILTLFHVKPLNRMNNSTEHNVLMSHGVLSSADDFLIRAKISIIYVLSQQGYNVWAINYRGSRYSRKHIILNPDIDAKFWDFSMHELGIYDLSACIDFVLNATGQTQLSIIGHSEGTSTTFVLTSTKPEYNAKIKLYIAMAPVAYFQDSGLVIRSLIALGPALNVLLKTFGIEEIIGYESFPKEIITAICSQGTIGYELCYNGILGSGVGRDPKNVDDDFFKIILGHYPAGTSRKNLNHFVQVGIRDLFAHYDYGSRRNKKVYGSIDPPIYDLGKITCKTAIVIGPNDKIVGVQDAERIRGELSNVVDYYLVPCKNFNHQDYIWGRNAHKVIYDHILSLLEKYAN